MPFKYCCQCKWAIKRWTIRGFKYTKVPDNSNNNGNNN